MFVLICDFQLSILISTEQYNMSLCKIYNVLSIYYEGKLRIYIPERNCILKSLNK